MGTIVTHLKCNCCEYSFVIGNLSGFRYEKQAVEYVPLSLRQKKEHEKGFDGILAFVYCRICDEVHKVVLLEYKQRVYEYGMLFCAPLKEGYNYSIYKTLLTINKYGFYDNSSSTYISKAKSEDKLAEKKQVCPKCKRRSDLLLNVACSFKCPRCSDGMISPVHIDCFD